MSCNIRFPLLALEKTFGTTPLNGFSHAVCEFHFGLIAQFTASFVDAEVEIEAEEFDSSAA